MSVAINSIVIPIYASVAVVLFASDLAGAQVPPSDADEFGIVYKANYRTKDVGWKKSIREGRGILDEMVANKGEDNALSSFGWDDLELNAAYAEYQIKKKNEVRFREYTRAIEKAQQEVDSRAQHIKEVRDQISKELAKGVARWNTLMAGNDEILIFIGKALGIKGVGMTLSALLQGLGKRIDSKLLRGGGKALGPVSTALSLVQLVEAYDEKVEMDLMIGRLLEMTELVAYLDVLLKKYDGLLAAQDKILNGLFREFYRCQ